MDRRHFSLVVLSSSIAAAMGCNSQAKQSHHAITPIDAPNIHEAMKELEESMEGLEYRMKEIGVAHASSASYDIQNATVGVRNGLNQLKRILGEPIW